MMYCHFFAVVDLNRQEFCSVPRPKLRYFFFLLFRSFAQLIENFTVLMNMKSI